jgi:hypothetical protein
MLTAGLFLRVFCDAAPVLEWDPNPESNLGGYRVYIGEASRSYAQTIDTGTRTSQELTNLFPGVTFYFAVTAYDRDGLESDYSEEIVYTPPVNGTNAALLATSLVRTNHASTLQFVGRAGQQCRVLFSTDLEHWQTLLATTLTNSHPMNSTDAGASNRPMCFYRVVVMPP